MRFTRRRDQRGSALPEASSVVVRRETLAAIAPGPYRRLVPRRGRRAVCRPCHLLRRLLDVRRSTHRQPPRSLRPRLPPRPRDRPEASSSRRAGGGGAGLREGDARSPRAQSAGPQPLRKPRLHPGGLPPGKRPRALLRQEPLGGVAAKKKVPATFFGVSGILPRFGGWHLFTFLTPNEPGRAPCDARPS